MLDGNGEALNFPSRPRYTGKSQEGGGGDGDIGVGKLFITEFWVYCIRRTGHLCNFPVRSCP